MTEIITLMSKNNSYYLKLISVNLGDKNIICFTKKTIGKTIAKE